MSYLKEEKELNLKGLFLSVCDKWKTIVSVCLLVALAIVIININGAIQYLEILGLGKVCISIFKYIIIIWVLIIVVMLLYYCCRYLFTDVIKSVQDYKQSFDLNLIGVIPSEKKKISFGLDKKIKKLKGIKIHLSDREKLIERVTNVICTHVSLEASERKAIVAIVSSCSDEEAIEFMSLIKNNADKYELVTAGDIMVSADAVKVTTDADYVVLIERENKSKYTELDETCRLLNSWNKNILGVVLLDTEAI